MTILIHKEGNTDDPSNFRPITLQTILSKGIASHIRNRIFTFAVENNYVETNIQKDFGQISQVQLNILNC